MCYCMEWLNSSPPSAAYMLQWIWTELVQIMACRLFSANIFFRTPLKTWSCHNGSFAVTGYSTGCHSNNQQCCQWWQSWHHDNSQISASFRNTSHTMDMLWEKFQWILPLYMKPISFQLKVSVVCSVTAAVYIDFCLKKLNVFSQHIGKKTNEYLNSTEQIPRNWNVDQLSMLITSWDIT